MQLVRNLYTGDERRLDGYKRKIREAKLAEELENAPRPHRASSGSSTKYLNTVPYGTRRRPDGDRRRRGRAAVLRQAGERADAARGRDARRHAAGAVGVLAGASTRAAAKARRNEVLRQDGRAQG